NRRLRRRAGVEHAAGAIERLQALERAAREAELAVVVVLEHEGVAPARPVEEREPARQREHAAGGELVRGRDAGEPRGRDRLERIAAPPLLLGGHEGEVRAARGGAE